MANHNGSGYFEGTYYTGSEETPVSSNNCYGDDQLPNFPNINYNLQVSQYAEQPNNEVQSARFGNTSIGQSYTASPSREPIDNSLGGSMTPYSPSVINMSPMITPQTPSTSHLTNHYEHYTLPKYFRPYLEQRPMPGASENVERPVDVHGTNPISSCSENTALQIQNPEIGSSEETMQHSMSRVMTKQLIQHPHPQSTSSGKNKTSRFRNFRESEINELERTIRMDRYPTEGRKRELASQLNIPLEAIHNWFQNRRRKEASLKKNILECKNKFPDPVHSQYKQLLVPQSQLFTLSQKEERLQMNSCKSSASQSPIYDHNEPSTSRQNTHILTDQVPMSNSVENQEISEELLEQQQQQYHHHHQTQQQQKNYHHHQNQQHQGHHHYHHQNQQNDHHHYQNQKQEEHHHHHQNRQQHYHTYHHQNQQQQEHYHHHQNQQQQEHYHHHHHQNQQQQELYHHHQNQQQQEHYHHHQNQQQQECYHHHHQNQQRQHHHHQIQQQQEHHHHQNLQKQEHHHHQQYHHQLQHQQLQHQYQQ